MVAVHENAATYFTCEPTEGRHKLTQKFSQTLWHMPLIQALIRQRQEDVYEFKARLSI